MPDEEKTERQKVREIMDKIYAMTPEEFNQFMYRNFQRACGNLLPSNGNKDQ